MSTLRPQDTKNSTSWVPDFQVEPMDNLIYLFRKEGHLCLLKYCCRFQ